MFPVSQVSVLCEPGGRDLGLMNWPCVQQQLEVPPGASSAGAAPTVPGTQQTQLPVLLSCCYKIVGLLIKAELDLRCKGKILPTLAHADL